MTAQLPAIMRSISICGAPWAAPSPWAWVSLWLNPSDGFGALATVAARKPDNLAIAVIDNEHYGETGMQRTHTSAGVDLAGIARSAGFRETATVRQTAELESAIPILHRVKGPVLVVLKVSSARDPLVLPPWDGPFLKTRFRQALLGAKAAA